ncbi:MAG: hypothetical protein EA352_06650 [Gemmatimonadales bacterium]|nr:MAG: hypothetical protein EA352_06650 [Gemmatimonadales bacterium]
MAADGAGTEDAGAPGGMTFDEFEARAHAMWEEIPDAYKAGVDGISVQPQAEAHPDRPEYYTLGMCFTEPYPSGYMGPDSTRSIVALYHGSFQKVAERAPAFDWEEELWETITHELRHHLEFLAEDDALEGLDYAMEETWKRGQGEDFDPWYFQSGLPLAPGTYRVEYDVYIEQVWQEPAFQAASELEFEWDGARWSIPRPDVLGDVHFIWLHGLDAGGGWVQLVLVKKRGMGERIRALFDSGPPELWESEAEPARLGDAPESPGPDDGRPGRAAGGPPPAPSDDDPDPDDGPDPDEGPDPDDDPDAPTGEPHG